MKFQMLFLSGDSNKTKNLQSLKWWTQIREN